MAIAIGLLGGCALPEMPAFGPAPSAGDRATPRMHGAGEELLAYLGRLAAMRESELPAEAARQRDLLQRAPSDVTRIKAALALSLASPGDDAELHALVDPVARASGGDVDVRSMASFVQALAAERRRAKESAVAASARLRDERRAVEAQRQRADALQ